MTDAAAPIKGAKRGPKGPPPIASYQILAEGTLEKLVTRVRESLLEGWQPLGGPFKVGTDWGVAQAMVK
jgi:hypothetical protein